MFKIVLRTTMPNMWYDLKIAQLEQGFDNKHNNIQGARERMDFNLYRILMYHTTLFSYFV